MIRALLLALISTSALADVTYEYGQCRFGQADSGTYYQSDKPHSNYLTPRCASVGIAFKMPERWSMPGVGWRAAALFSGSVEARDNLAPMNDGLYDPTPCSNAHWANCNSYFGGSGRMQGIQVSVTKERAIRGRWWAQGEVGLLFFEHFFNGYAKPADFDGEPMVRGGYVQGVSTRWEDAGLNQYSSIFNMPIPMIGASIGYGPAYFAARYHHAPNATELTSRAGLSITDHSVFQLTAGVRF